MEYTSVQAKLKLLFEKILEPGYVMNNYYADGLINKLSSCTDSEISNIAANPQISDLIIKTFNLAQNSHNSVKVFVTRMLSIMSRKELNLSKMLCSHTSRVIDGFQNIDSPDMNPSLRVALLEVALSLVIHNTGICSILETGIWKKILRLCNEQHTVFVVRQTYKFAAKFLWKLNDIGDEANIKTVLTFILEPLSDTDFLTLRSLTSEEENNICKTLEPMLQMLNSILTEENRAQSPSIIMTFLNKEFNISSHLIIVVDRMRREDVVLLTARLTFWVTLSRIAIAKPNMPGLIYSSDDFMELTAFYINVVHALIQRRSATGVIDYCSACNLIWDAVWKDKPPVVMRDGKTHHYQNQLFIICLVPLIVYVKKDDRQVSQTDESVDTLIAKAMNWSCEHTTRVCFALRDLSTELGTDVMVQCVKRLTCLKNNLNDEQANLMFQGMFYVLREYDPTNAKSKMVDEENYDDDQEKGVIMTHVMETVLTLVKNHNINWHESLEIICLYTIVHNILQRPNLSCKFIVTALNVIALTVKKFLPPNLSLLIESKPGTSMHEIGKLIYTKMHDRNWEIRDSALELLLVCTDISYIKFPPFQKQLIENNLLNVAATIAFNDFEYYVQVSALKCVGAATKVNSLWDQLKLQYPDIQDKIISILRNNQEGIVRKEACNVLCDIYQNLKLTPTFKNTLYEHMVSSSLSDFHWEVQLSALKFWKIVIQSFLSDQGMLDGTFPPVTFSRATRKIVTLNETEIKKRLLSILDELSSIGCLTLLVKLLHEDTDTEIMESALTISQDLLNVLTEYKVPDSMKPGENEVTIDELIVEETEEENGQDNDEDMSEQDMTEKSDKVIEGILNCDDINLLSNIYERHMSLQNDKPETVVKPRMRLVKNATPYFFVNYLKSKDFKKIVDQKRKWNDGIVSMSSLLDDVLGIYEVNDEINTLDCY